MHLQPVTTPTAPDTRHPSTAEIENAGEVQNRLLHTVAPRMRSLDYAGRCLQAGSVGGDSFDFLARRTGRLMLSVGDVSGKGMSAALMMAALHASLRTHYTSTSRELNMKTVLRSVNRQFVRATAARDYASLFLAEYDDGAQRLRYANCGQVRPLLLHADGNAEWLESTSTPLGLFEDWNCFTRDLVLRPGDLLVVYTDGVTEQTDGDGREFGEQRLLESVRPLRRLPVRSVIDGILRTCLEFGGRVERDDITLVAARCSSADPDGTAASFPWTPNGAEG